jgi:3-deoxy-D-manno-octulosonic-acid transferase
MSVAAYWRYNALLALASPALTALLVSRLAHGKSREGWRERWGDLPAALHHKTAPRLWVHAASVGEVVAATPILTLLRERLPDWQFVCSTITPGGQETARNQIGKTLDTVIYAPFDLPWAAQKAARTVQPDLYVNLETELWPNLLYHVRQTGAKMALVNGRISDRSIGRYRRFRNLFGWTLQQFDRLLVQTAQDASRFRDIGAAAERLTVVGNAKFDQKTERLTPAQAAALKQELGIAPDAPVWVVGSTRTAEEETQILSAYRQARETVPNLALIHAPRHIERAEELAGLMRSQGLHPVRRSQVAPASVPVTQLILDTFGELARVYAVGEVAYIGNSLLPPGGGQNLLQPLAQGKPVLYGPYMNDFRDLVAMAERAGLGTKVRTADELAAQVVTRIRETSKRESFAARAEAMLAENRGAAQRYADSLLALVQE